MLEKLQKRLEEIKGVKEQQIANINALIGREQEVVEMIEHLTNPPIASAPPFEECINPDELTPAPPV